MVDDDFEGSLEQEPTMVRDDQLFDVVKDLRTIKNILLFWTIATVIANLAIFAAISEASS